MYAVGSVRFVCWATYVNEKSWRTSAEASTTAAISVEAKLQ